MIVIADEERNNINQSKIAPKESTEHKPIRKIASPPTEIASATKVKEPDTKIVTPKELHQAPESKTDTKPQPKPSIVQSQEPIKSQPNTEYTDESYPQDYYGEQYQYDPNAPYDPSQYGEMYDPEHYDPNQQYMTQEEYEQHYGPYDPNTQYTEEAQQQPYDPNQYISKQPTDTKGDLQQKQDPKQTFDEKNRTSLAQEAPKMAPNQTKPKEQTLPQQSQPLKEQKQDTKK